MQDRAFHTFANDMIKLSVDKTKLTSLLARTRAFILQILISMFGFEPREVTGSCRETDP